MIKAGNTINDTISDNMSDDTSSIIQETQNSYIDWLYDVIFKLHGDNLFDTEKSLIRLIVQLMKICFFDKFAAAWNSKVNKYKITYITLDAYTNELRLFIPYYIQIMPNFIDDKSIVSIDSIQRLKNLAIEFEFLYNWGSVPDKEIMRLFVNEINIQKLEDWFYKELGKAEV